MILKNFNSSEIMSRSENLDKNEKFADKVQKIHEQLSEEESYISDSMSNENSKEKSGKFGSEINQDKEDFIEMAERQLNSDILLVNLFYLIVYLSTIL